MITSFIEGRVRIRHEALKNAEAVQTVLELLQSYPGVLEASANPRTGGILIHYDPKQIGQEDLLLAEQTLRGFLGIEEERESEESEPQGLLSGLWPHLAGGCALSRRQENRLLGLTLALCLGSAFFSRRLHVWAGGSFALMALGHLLRRKAGW